MTRRAGWGHSAIVARWMTRVGAVLLCGATLTAGVGRARADAPVVKPEWVGAGSCAARGCHGGVNQAQPGRGDVRSLGGEFTTWRTFDPHAGAYRVLLSERSRGIARRLRTQLEDRPAHEARACLVCHSPDAIDLVAHRSGQSDDLPARLPEGVGCESCHGPASLWKDIHVATTWKTRTVAAKVEAGMTDLTTASGRAGLCVACHVGDASRGMDVNHDLIAAGHPRLNFEYASYLATTPRHWAEPKEASEVQAWAVGQATTARASVDLLAGRAASASKNGLAPWPELSEYACFSCHRELPATVSKTPEGVGLGASPLPWATWPLAVLPELAAFTARPDVNPSSPQSVWAPLRATMSDDEPDPARVAGLARDASRAMKAWIDVIQVEHFDEARSEVLLKSLAAKPVPDASMTWDEATQRYLGMSALVRSRGGPESPRIPSEIRSSLETAPNLLTFPPGFDGPHRVRGPDSPSGPGGAKR